MSYIAAVKIRKKTPYQVDTEESFVIYLESYYSFSHAQRLAQSSIISLRTMRCVLAPAQSCQ